MSNERHTNFLDGLNDAQRVAAEHFDGAALIIAGAGSGKTRTITYRIAHMIQSGVKPWNILALTFTNKAAREMRERIEMVVPPSQLRGLWMGTFHGVFRRILNKEAALIGFPENFTIYETADSKNIVKSLVKEFELQEEKYKPQNIFGRISLAKNSLITPAAYAANETARAEDAEAGCPEFYRIYAQYCQRCRANGAMDFDDILLYMNVLLRDHPEATARYAEMFRYIMVDEYQDTNFSQYLIVKKLASMHGNICVVGDDSQSIYSFRGARIENILKFQKDFPECKVYKLEQNYRSTRTIVEAANSLIAHNEQRLDKNLYSEQEAGEQIRVVECFSDKDEAFRVVGDIGSNIRSGVLPSQISILYRTNMQSRALEEGLRSRNIPYKVYGGQSFYQRTEIKDILCYLRLAVNPKDDEALKRIINVPARGIGATSLARIEEAASHSDRSIFETLKTVSLEDIGVRGPAKNGIARFLEAFTELQSLTETLDAYEFAMQAARSSGMIAFYSLSKAVEDRTKLDNIEELLNSIKSFTSTPPMGPEAAEQEADETQTSTSDTGMMTIGMWLSEVSLLTDMDSEDSDRGEHVTLLTVHSSKGLEFDYTYIVGMEEQLFPSVRGVEDMSQIEEERRLFYVALTRARRKVTLSYALQRFKWGEIKDCSPSRFLNEIDPKYLELSAERIDPYAKPQARFERTDDEEQTTSHRSYDRFNNKEKPQHSRQFERSSQSSSGTVYSKNSAPRPEPSTGSNKSSSIGGNFRKIAPTENVSVASAGDLSVGITVAHERFGNGVIRSIEQTPSDTMVSVDFTAHGQKTLLMKYAKLRVVK